MKIHQSCDECGGDKVRQVTYTGNIRMLVCQDCGYRKGEDD